MAVDKQIVYLVSICILIILTSLTGGLDISCGVLFSDKCQRGKFRDATGLVATSLVLFIAALVFSILVLVKKYRWAGYAEIATTGFAAILMLAAVCVLNSGWGYAGATMAVITMTLAIELTIYILIDIFV